MLSYCFASWLSKITAFGFYKENGLVWQIEGLVNMNMEKDRKATVVKVLWGSCWLSRPIYAFLTKMACLIFAVLVFQRLLY